MRSIYSILTENVSYKDSIDTFNQIITEWDFLGDVTDPYVSNIVVNGDEIGVTCEFWDPDVDDYISCDGGTFKAPEIVKMLKEVDFNKSSNVYEDARPIFDELNQLVDWNKVSDELYRLRDAELKDMGIEDEDME